MFASLLPKSAPFFEMLLEQNSHLRHMSRLLLAMLEDLSKAAEGGRVAADRDPESIDRLLASRGVKPIDFAGWKKVDAYERAEGAKEGREHKKVIDPEQMRALAHA